MIVQVFVYYLDPGLIVRNLMAHYEAIGMVEIYHVHMSHRLAEPADLTNEKCRWVAVWRCHYGTI